MPSDLPGDWKHLAQQASNEMNSEKLLELVDELNQALREREDKPRQQRQQQTSSNRLARPGFSMGHGSH